MDLPGPLSIPPLKNPQKASGVSKLKFDKDAWRFGSIFENASMFKSVSWRKNAAGEADGDVVVLDRSAASRTMIAICGSYISILP